MCYKIVTEVAAVHGRITNVHNNLGLPFLPCQGWSSYCHNWPLSLSTTKTSKISGMRHYNMGDQMAFWWQISYFRPLMRTDPLFFSAVFPSPATELPLLETEWFVHSYTIPFTTNSHTKKKTLKNWDTGWCPLDLQALWHICCHSSLECPVLKTSQVNRCKAEILCYHMHSSPTTSTWLWPSCDQNAQVQEKVGEAAQLCVEIHFAFHS